MPIYEYYCPTCHRIFSFLAKTVSESSRLPSCPKCGGDDMSKRMSSFAVVGATRKSSGASGVGGEESGGAGDDLDPRAERELARLMAQAEGIDENDPRQLGGLMRRMAEITGERLDPEMEEAVRRLESGEDPDKIEEEMGELFGEDAGGMAGLGAPSVDDGLYSF